MLGTHDLAAMCSCKCGYPIGDALGDRARSRMRFARRRKFVSRREDDEARAPEYFDFAPVCSCSCRHGPPAHDLPCRRQHITLLEI